MDYSNDQMRRAQSQKQNQSLKEQPKEELVSIIESKDQTIKNLLAQLESQYTMSKNSQQEVVNLNSSELHVAYLHASPIVFKDQVKTSRMGLSSVPYLDFMSEWKTIK